MSLIKQLWLAIALVMLVAFAGSFLVSSLSAKAYLEEQLLLKNLDNATSLASTLSQMPKDEVTIELTWTGFWNPDMMSDEAKDELGIF